MALAALALATPSVSAASIPHAGAGTSWSVYHGNPLGTGEDTSGVTFSPPSLAWTSPVLDGKVYGEPLEATGRVYVATGNDTIYALAADTGAVLWSTHVGTPVPSSDLVCGDISPTVGITGTPVLDVARGEIFAVADELSNGVPAHVLVGLNMYSGSAVVGENVDPPGQLTSAILQRTGLNLDNGNVVFGYGGNDGDCSTYSGWVGSVPEGGGTPHYYQAVPIGHDGAVWMGGAAPEVDAAGNIWVATGNGSSSIPTTSATRCSSSPGLLADAVLRPFVVDHRQRPRRRPRVHGARPALRRVGAPGGQVLHRVPPEPGSLGGSRLSTPDLGLRERRRRRGRRVGHRRLRAVRQRGRGDRDQPARDRVAGQQRIRAPDRRRRPRLVDRREHALRARSGHRARHATGVGRWRGQPLPHALGG